jgi:PAS domain-containing protein
VPLPNLAVDYETIFAHAPIGMCVSERRIMQVCNLALARMFGYLPGELNGESFKVL